MTLEYTKDKDYTIQRSQSSPNWFHVIHKGKIVALVMSVETGRQYIHKEVCSKECTCEYLTKEHFRRIA